MTNAALATPQASASDTIKTTGILHFTIGVRDHIAAAKFIWECLAARTCARPSDTPSWSAVAAISCWRRAAIM